MKPLLGHLNKYLCKISGDGDCSHKIKRRLLLGRKVMTDLDSILRNRNVADKGLSSHIYGFSSSVQVSCSVESDSLQPHE